MMNNIQEKDKIANSEELLEEQKILNDAEKIIKKFNYKPSHAKNNRFIIVIPIILLLVIILLFSTVFALININKSTIINGVFIKGIDVSNLTIEEAKEKVSSELNKILETELVLSYEDYNAVLIPSQLGFSYDVSSSVESAYALGKSENIFKNNFQILKAMTSTTTIIPSVSYDSDLFDSAVSEINATITNAVIQPTYYIEDNSLILSNGKDGVLVDSQSFLSNILYFLSTSSDNNKIEVPVVNTTANKIDIEDIYKKIYKDPVDASFKTDPYIVYPSSTGIDFAITIEEAIAMLDTYQEEYIVPLKTLYPTVTTNQIGNEAFPDLLAEFTTYYTSSNSNRCTNIILASQKISGTVLMPGEEFSYNQVVGKRTAAAGFKEAAAYSNGQVVQEYGGGICQVSSTIYNAVLYANLEITKRDNHCYKPSYVKPGLDATVSWGGPEFCFKNNRSYPIRIVCENKNKVLHVYIYGLKTDSDYTVVLDTEYLSTVYAKTVYETDSSLASGESRVISSGSNGCKVAAYKTLYDSNGNYVSRELISKDTYNAHNKIVAVGP